jgi:uncharacterized membrane protein
MKPNNYYKIKQLAIKIIIFLGIILTWCNITISQRFLHELSLKEWIEHILFGIIFAIVFMLIARRDKKDKAKKQESQKTWVKIVGFIGFIFCCNLTIGQHFWHRLSTSEWIPGIVYGIIVATSLFIIRKYRKDKYRFR